MNNRLVDDYYDAIVKLFQENHIQDKVFLDQIKRRIEEVSESQDLLTVEMLEEEFGTPQEIFDAYFEHLDHQYIIQKMNRRSLMKKLVIFIVAIMLCLAAFFIYRLNQLYLDSKDAKVHEIRTTIIEED